ncbi:MAG: hypothetical protein R2697_02770 [Ilumatobacteraceae bacterium]
MAPLLAEGIFGTSAVTLPPDDRFAGMTYDDALAAFEAEPPIEVLFEEGRSRRRATDTLPATRRGSTRGRFRKATARSWYLARDGVAGGVLADLPAEPEHR